MQLLASGTSRATAKTVVALILLWGIVLLVNYPVLVYDMMYYEQPILYLANQKITSWLDLWHVYSHPQVLEPVNIPFFRPSGHFLLYQLVTSVLSWHNTRGLLAVNFFFLAASCYLMLRLYQRCFPGFRVGGYLACGFYLMHPALMLSRLSPMHFEFASVFFVLAGLCLFMQFCERRQPGFLLGALGCYFVAITFKETGLLLGPVMFLYVCFATYQQQSWQAYRRALWSSATRQVLILLVVVTLTFALYLSLMWPTLLPYQLRSTAWTSEAPLALVKCLQMLFGFLPTVHATTSTSTSDSVLLWELMIYPAVVKGVLWLGLGVLLWTSGQLFVVQRQRPFASSLPLKRSLLFFLMAALAFMVMPVLWARARPWHLALCLVFVSLCVGFSLEYLGRVLALSPSRLRQVGGGLAVVVALLTVWVTTVNVHFIDQQPSGFALRLNRNAVLHPPTLSRAFSAHSVLVVEDSVLHNDYLLGDSVYPDSLYEGAVAIQHLLPLRGFYQFPPQFGGTLFRWAYLNPSLQEEIYPFQIGEMQAVQTITLYHWLQHVDDIFCVGYDRFAVWHDRTAAFIAALLAEQTRRHLTVHVYQADEARALPAQPTRVMRPLLGDVTYCEMQCDADTHCAGFVVADVPSGDHRIRHCYLASSLQPGSASCERCTRYSRAG